MQFVLGMKLVLFCFAFFWGERDIQELGSHQTTKQRKLTDFPVAQTVAEYKGRALFGPVVLPYLDKLHAEQVKAGIM